LDEAQIIRPGKWFNSLIAVEGWLVVIESGEGGTFGQDSQD
jgi:hypothetical protein